MSTVTFTAVLRVNDLQSNQFDAAKEQLQSFSDMQGRCTCKIVTEVSTRLRTCHTFCNYALLALKV